MGHLDRARYPRQYAEQEPTAEKLGIVENIQSIARMLRRKVDLQERRKGKRLTKEQTNRMFRELVLEEATYKSSDNANYWAQEMDIHGRKNIEIDTLLLGRYQMLEDATRLAASKSLAAAELGIENPGY